MKKRTVSVELDAETLRRLATLGEPSEVLSLLARSVVDSMGHPARAQRDQTDTSLRAERDKVDQHSADDARPEDESGEWHRRWQGPFTVEREATDLSLNGERAQADTVLVDQREANEKLVLATLRAHELADVAKDQAEASACQLRSVAEYREMSIGILGHDLRNPLAAILTFAGLLLRRGRLDEQDAKSVSRIIRSTQRMGRMITQLLDLTRARLGGGLPIEVKPTDLQEVCRNVVEEFGPIMRLAVEGDLTGVWDHDRLMEALSNLGGNAVEHATAGTVVTVRATSAGEAVVLTVSNQGEPIPADVSPFIFEPFRQGREREKSPNRNLGLGLGLYITQQIVLSHGGTLEAHSADGTTTFTMRLPRGLPSPNPEGPDAPKVPSPEAARPPSATSSA